jgi:hypothetical protein
VGDGPTDGPTNQRTQSLIEVLFAPKNHEEENIKNIKKLWLEKNIMTEKNS